MTKEKEYAEFKRTFDIGKEILDKLRMMDESAVIAGGAASNWFREKPCGDIDVFLRPKVSRTLTLDTPEHTKNVLGALGFATENTRLSETTQGNSVYTVSYKGISVDVCVLHTTIPPRQYCFERFDWDVAKVVFEYRPIAGLGCFATHPSYGQALTTKTATADLSNVLPKDWEEVVHLRYYKLRKKHPDFVFRVIAPDGSVLYNDDMERVLQVKYSGF